MITLENDAVLVEISAHGAELQRLLSKDSRLEYLWNADSTYWGKHSPILFPFVGGLKNDHYLYEGKSYEMSRHGFAREKTFEIQQVSAHEVLFTLRDDESTRLVYPFEFLLQVRYLLDGNRLRCSYEVTNPSTSILYFSIGGHPAFRVPDSPETVYTDYFLVFNNDISLMRWNLQDGLISDKSEQIELVNKQLSLSPKLFYNDAIVLKNIRSDEVRLGNNKNGHGLLFHFKNFPYFGIWAAKDAPFVCLEPWCGIADSVNHNQQLTEKEGIIKLDPGEYWMREWSVGVF